MRRRALFPPLLLVLLLLVVFGTGMRCIVGSVSHVVDGDTFDVVANTPVGWGDDCAVAPGQQYRVRLIGVDTPEVYGQAECYGSQASDYAKSILNGRGVCLMRDTSCTDRYGRLLAYVWVDTDPSSPGCELFLNQELVHQGYANAWDYPPDSLFSGVLKAAECEAYQAGRGMWSACSGLPAPTGCSSPPAPSPGPTAAPSPGDPCGPCAASDCNCSDFSTWQQAKTCLDAHPGDPFRLDGDHDGIPFESLPGAP